MTDFARIGADEWRLDVPSPRLEHLASSTFEDIVQLISAQMALGPVNRGHQCQQSREGPRDCYRPEIILVVAPLTVDLFHNSASGYRAQYYAGVSIGERANRWALDSLLPRILALLDTHRRKRTCSLDWVERSLQHDYAKLWIGQGWWRHTKALRHLRVTRWEGNARIWTERARGAARDSQEFKKWRACCRAPLTPDTENRIVIKGAWLNRDGIAVVKKSPIDRANDLHELGMT